MKNIFDRKLKKYFYDKMDLRIFHFMRRNSFTALVPSSGGQVLILEWYENYHEKTVGISLLNYFSFIFPSS